MPRLEDHPYFETVVTWLRAQPKGEQIAWCDALMTRSVPFSRYSLNIILPYLEDLGDEEDLGRGIFVIDERADYYFDKQEEEESEDFTPFEAIQRRMHPGLPLVAKPESLLEITYDVKGWPEHALLDGEPLTWSDKLAWELANINYDCNGQEMAYTPGFVSERLSEFAKLYAKRPDLVFVWQPELYIDDSQDAQDAEDVEYVDEEAEFERVCQALTALPPGTEIAWSDDSMGPMHPWGQSWIDVVSDLLNEVLQLNWVWTLESAPQNPHAARDKMSVTCPMDATYSFIVDEQENIIEAVLATDSGKTYTIIPRDVDAQHDIPYAEKVGPVPGGTLYTTRVFTPFKASQVLHEWVREHTGRNDITFRWDPAAEASPMLRSALEGLAEVHEKLGHQERELIQISESLNIDVQSFDWLTALGFEKAGEVVASHGECIDDFSKPSDIGL